MPGEGARPYAAFRSYLEQGAGRSLTAVAQQLHKSRTLIGRWSAQWAWSARAAAWDAALAAAFDRELGEARRDHARVHVAQTARTLEVVGQWLAQADGAALSASEAVALRRSALDADRLVLGLGADTETALPAEPGAKMDASALTDEERRDHLRQLRDEVDRRLAADPPTWPATLTVPDLRRS